MYLKRIGYRGHPSPNATTLRDLHRHHLYAVPFENLDIPLKREIVLDVSRIYDKIVRRRRGGFCYEQNALFAWAVKHIGFNADMLSARVARPDGTYGREFDHMLLLVRVDGEEWIADVGFGDSFIEPLRFVPDELQRDRGLEYQIVREDDAYILCRREGDRWKKLFAFTTAPRRLDEFTPMCLFQQTSPESHFTRNRICSIATPTGRVTLTATSLIVTEEDGARSETPVDSPAHFERLLEERFGIKLTGFAAVV